MIKDKGYWTFDNVKEEALKYKSRNDFNRNSKSAYLSAYRNGWLDEVCSHMKNKNYSFKSVSEEALKYNSKVEFRKNSNPYYNAAHRNGWLDDICSHMKPQGNLYKRYVYKVLFDDNSVYIGLTYNFDKRKIEHIKMNKSSVYKHILKTGKEPKFELVSDLVDREEAINIECELIKKYSDLGFNVLNIVKGGGLGGSNIIWTLDKVREEALKYTNRNSFKLGSPSAYISAHRNNWLDDICGHMTEIRKSNGYWTKEKCQEEASMYNSKMDFKKNSKAYQIAYKNKWLDDICKHMESVRKPSGYWTKERCQEEALKYNSRTEFKKNSHAYYKALDNDWLNDICSHMLKVEKFNEWVLQNSDKENDIYKKVFRKEEFQDFIKERKIKVNII